MRTFRVAVIAVVVAGVLSACGRLGPPADEVIIRDETLVLDANARSMLTEFRDDGTLVFTSNDDTLVSTSNVGGPLPGVVVGSILVSEPTAVAPFGLLRRVTYLDTSVPGLLTVKTVQATLGEAIQKGSLSVELTIDADDPSEFIPSSPSVRVLPRSTAVADGAAAPGLGTTALEDGIGLSFDEVVYDEEVVDVAGLFENLALNAFTGSLVDIRPAAGHRPAAVGLLLDQQDAVSVKDGPTQVDLGRGIALLGDEKIGKFLAGGLRVHGHHLEGYLADAAVALLIVAVLGVAKAGLREGLKLADEFIHGALLCHRRLPLVPVAGTAAQAG